MKSIIGSVKLQPYIKQIRGISFKPTEISKSKKTGTTPVLKANNIKELGLDDSSLIYISSQRIKPEQYIRPGDILIAASSGSKKVIGKNIFFPDAYEASFGAFCKLVRPQKNLYPEYLKHFFKTRYYRNEIERSVQGANINNLKNEHLDNLKIRIPALNDQKRIARLLGKVEGLIAQRKQHLQQLDDLLKSVFLEMFGDPIRNEKGWDKELFENLLLEIESGKSPKCEARIARENEWGVLKLGAVTGCVFKEGESKALPVSIEPHTKYEVKKGDVLFSRKNTYGLVAACAYVFETRSKLLLPDLIFRFVLKDDKELNPIYLWKLLSSHSQRGKIRSLASGAAGSMPNISKANLKKVLLPIPPINLQNKFSKIIEKVEVLKLNYQKSLSDLKQLYGALSQKAFKGELDYLSDGEDGESLETPEPKEIQLAMEPSKQAKTISDRKAFLTSELQRFVTDSQGDISVQSFFSTLDLSGFDTDDELSVETLGDYDHVKQWLFNAIESGEVTQTNNRMKLDDKIQAGNRVVVRNAQPSV